MRNASHYALFCAFFKIGLCGFGGVAGWVRPVIVDERGWLDEREFAELLGAATSFRAPIPSISRSCSAIVFRALPVRPDRRLRPAARPLGILIAIASFYINSPRVLPSKLALAGAAAATAGLVVGNAYKLAKAFRRACRAILIATVTFALTGIFHFSLMTTLAMYSLRLRAFRAHGRRAMTPRHEPAPLARLALTFATLSLGAVGGAMRPCPNCIARWWRSRTTWMMRPSRISSRWRRRRRGQTSLS